MSYFAPLKHCTEAIELSEELYKALGQLPCTFSFCRTRSCLRRLRSEFKGAFLTILIFEDLAIRAGGPLIDVLMLHYVCSCCEEPFGVDFVEIGLVPPLISYDVICVETLHLNNVARF